LIEQPGPGRPRGLLARTDQRFVVEWEGPGGRVLPEAKAAETSVITGPATA
jgi:hypothetical protein